jgi:leucyl aminopeptidase
MPFFDEYFDMLKSDIADVKNIGGMNAGAITAGKFLEMFTKNEKVEHAYPWIHLDIAGPAFLSSEDAYRGKNGSGVGIRLLYNFIKKYAK